MALTITQINTAITNALATATGLTYHQDVSELTEGIQDLPVLQVYWQSSAPANTESDRFTSSIGVAQIDHVFHADLYAHQRSDISTDMAALFPLVDAVIDRLQAQQHQNFFSLAGVKGFAWRIERLQFQTGDALYIGARFVITIRIF